MTRKAMTGGRQASRRRNDFVTFIPLAAYLSPGLLVPHGSPPNLPVSLRPHPAAHLHTCLRRGRLCVCHLQEILGEPQVKVSKHLRYLKEHGMVEADSQANWIVPVAQETAPRTDGEPGVSPGLRARGRDLRAGCETPANFARSWRRTDRSAVAESAQASSP